MVEKYVRYIIQERILKVLSKVECANITEIARKSKIIALTAKKHLERLKRDGVVEEKNKGSNRFFMLIRENQTEIRTYS